MLTADVKEQYGVYYMTREEHFFIQLLSDHLKGRQTEPCTGVNWDTIRYLSRAHQVDGIVYYQCKHFLPENICHDFEKAECATFFLFTNRRISMMKIENILRKANISFFTVKGFAVAQYYPIPALRTMGDCDYIISSNDVELADKSLQYAGFKKVNVYMQHEWTYEEKGLLFELHDVLIRENEYISAIQASFFNNYNEYLKDGQLDWNFHFLYLLIHLRKHIINNGVGIRQFMDLAVIINSEIKLDWEWLNQKCSELKITQFACACYDLLHFWFDVTVNCMNSTLDAAFIEKMSKTILANGVFGFDNKRNLENSAKNSILMGNAPRWINRTKAIIFSIFLPYRYMKRYPGCQYVEKKIYLMPIAWVHRMVMLTLRKDKSTSIRTLHKYFVEKKELDEREEFLYKMGLKQQKDIERND